MDIIPPQMQALSGTGTRPISGVQQEHCPTKWKRSVTCNELYLHQRTIKVAPVAASVTYLIGLYSIFACACCCCCCGWIVQHICLCLLLLLLWSLLFCLLSIEMQWRRQCSSWLYLLWYCWLYCILRCCIPIDWWYYCSMFSLEKFSCTIFYFIH